MAAREDSPGLAPFLAPSDVIDCDHQRLVALAAEARQGAADEAEVAARLFLVARDRVAYDPYGPFFLREHYRASATLERARGFCVQKAVLLCALGRAAGIPSRLTFVDIRNLRAPPHFVELLGTNLFAFHCYAELHLDGRWLGATPAFDRGLSRAHGFPLVTFDGRHDAFFAAEDLEGRPFIEYVRRRGTFADLPFEELVAGCVEVYGAERMESWRAAFLASGRR